MDMDMDLTDEETEIDMDMGLTTDEETFNNPTPNHNHNPLPHRKNALSPARSTLDPPNTDNNLSDSDLSEAMDMDSTEDEMEMPKAVGPIKQGFVCLTRGNHVGIRFGKPRLWVPPQGLVGAGDETEVEEQDGEEDVPPRGLVGGGDDAEVEEQGEKGEEEGVLPSVEEIMDWIPVLPQRGGGNSTPQLRGSMPSNPITISDSTDEEEEQLSPKTNAPPQPSGPMPSNPITVSDSTEEEELPPPKTKRRPRKNHFPTHHRRNAISGPSGRSPLPPLLPRPAHLPATVSHPPRPQPPRPQPSRSQPPRPQAPIQGDGISTILHAASLLDHSATTPCTHAHCPITTPHGSGLYRHPIPIPGSDRANAYFAPSVPPLEVVAAFNQVVLLGGLGGGFGVGGFRGAGGGRGVGSWGVVAGFFECHTQVCRVGGLVDWWGGWVGRRGVARGPRWGVFSGVGGGVGRRG
ncbi:MAG: hypothetical protein LQ350_004271 [Teloschistes chrysophthalmus]|nr:MAG: hypothetical protein LQ350_004271 [Niorma chrysophthalma]